MVNLLTACLGEPSPQVFGLISLLSLSTPHFVGPSHFLDQGRAGVTTRSPAARKKGAVVVICGMCVVVELASKL